MSKESGGKRNLEVKVKVVWVWSQCPCFLRALLAAETLYRLPCILQTFSSATHPSALIIRCLSFVIMSYYGQFLLTRWLISLRQKVHIPWEHHDRPQSFTWPRVHELLRHEGIWRAHGRSHRPWGSEELSLTLRPCPNWALFRLLVLLWSNQHVLPQALYQHLERSANSSPQGAPRPRERSHHWTVLSAEHLDSGLRKYRLNPCFTTDEPWDLADYDFFTSVSLPINNGCLIKLFQELKEIICRAWHGVSLQ